MTISGDFDGYNQIVTSICLFFNGPSGNGHYFEHALSTFDIDSNLESRVWQTKISLIDFTNDIETKNYVVHNMVFLRKTDITQTILAKVTTICQKFTAQESSHMWSTWSLKAKSMPEKSTTLQLTTVMGQGRWESNQRADALSIYTCCVLQNVPSCACASNM